MILVRVWKLDNCRPIRRTCRVVSRRDEPGGIFWLYSIFMHSSILTLTKSSCVINQLWWTLAFLVSGFG